MFSEYFLKSKSLFYSLLVTLPLFILYEIGIFYMFQADVAYVKNGADVLIEEFIKMIGLNGYYAASSIFILVLFIVLIGQRKSFKTFDISLKYITIMIFESLIYAAVLMMVLQNIYLIQGLTTSILNNFILSIGAGLYEELIFRFFLLFILAKSFSLFKSLTISAVPSGELSSIIRIFKSSL